MSLDVDSYSDTVTHFPFQKCILFMLYQLLVSLIKGNCIVVACSKSFHNYIHDKNENVSLSVVLV